MRLTFSHGVTLHLGPQSTTLQNCCVMGGGCGQKASSTLSTFPLPWRTSWMQFTERVWSASASERERAINGDSIPPFNGGD